MRFKPRLKPRVFLCAALLLCAGHIFSPSSARVDSYAINAIGGPPFLSEAVPPLVMGRDHSIDLAGLDSLLDRAFQLMSTRRAAAATAAPVISSRGGEGLITQAVFWPSRTTGADTVTWTGDVRSLLVDDKGIMRDEEGRIVSYFFDNQAGRTKACVGAAMSGGICPSPGVITELDNIDYLWRVSDWLNALPDPLTNRGFYISSVALRYIFTWNDANINGRINAGEVIPFVHTNHEAIPLLDEASIRWLRGQDQPGKRSRKYGTVTWRMGDVIHSSPVLVGAPAENYDLIWDDPTYRAFYKQYRNRRVMAYFGANDGMFRAVNAGFYQPGSGFVRTLGNETDTPVLGQEMWAYVPYNLLPHLERLTMPNYDHQYFVDLRPRVFDARIFPPSDKHPHGWGTILVGGMRLGGGYVKSEVEGVREFASSYFVFDVTDPEKPPVLLGETTTNTAQGACAGNNCLNLGFTLSVPTVVPIRANTEEVRWFLLLGSGPDSNNPDIVSTQRASIAVIPMEDYLGNEDHANWSNLRIPDVAPRTDATGAIRVQGGRDSFISTGMVSVDYDFDFFTDILFFGTTSGSGTGSSGNLQRLKVEGRINPKNWHSAVVFNARRPISGEPNVGRHGDDVWLYFGTGRLWIAADKMSTEVETLYGLMEKKKTIGPAYNFANVSKASLKNVTGILVDADTYELFCETGAVCDPKTLEYKTFHRLRDAIISQPNLGGWYRELPPGMRTLGKPLLLGGLVNFTVFSPDPGSDMYPSQGESHLYSLYYLTGTPWIRNIFGEVNPTQGGRAYVTYRRVLGPGMAITPTLHIGQQRGARVFVQTSTGEIVGIDQPELPIDTTRSGRGIWHSIDVE